MSSDRAVEEPLAVLVREARAGRKDAFDRLARRILPRIRRWALVKTGDPDDADEVVQRVLVRTHRSLETFRGEARFESWLYRITARVSVDLHRSRKARTRRRETLMREAEMESPGSDPWTRLEHSETQDLVRTFLGELSEKQREAFDLVDLQGYEPGEAADLLEMNPNTLRVHLHRARRSLRRALVEADPALAEEYGA